MATALATPIARVPVLDLLAEEVVVQVDALRSGGGGVDAKGRRRWRVVMWVEPQWVVARLPEAGVRGRVHGHLRQQVAGWSAMRKFLVGGQLVGVSDIWTSRHGHVLIMWVLIHWY